MPKIVILDGYVANPGDIDWKPIERLGTLKIYDRTPDNKVYSRAQAAEILIVNKQKLDWYYISRLKKLKCICTLATGYNNIDIEAAKHFGITVCNAVGYSSTSVAQHVFSLILELTNNIGLHNKSVQNNEWANSIDWGYWKSPLMELSGLTIGILGLGKIGKEVAKIAAAFNMKIIATRKNKNKPSPENIEIVSMERLFSESDILTLHAPLTEETNQIINKKTLFLMKASALLINTARGGLVNEEDLRNALLEGKIGGAGLDVLSSEPPPENHILLNIPNCVISPHIAWATKASRERLLEIVGKNIEAFLARKPQNVVV